MEDFRALFPICQNTVYLNNAGVAPPPVTVRAAMEHWLRDMEDNGLTEDDRWEAMAEGVRTRVANLIGAAPDNVTFVRNTSHGLGLIAEGLDLQAGDEVAVATAIEYPSNVYPWWHLQHRGVQVRDIRAENGGVSPQAVKDALTDRTRLVSVSAVQYASGHRTDLESIGKLCRDRGVLFCVDGIQQVGAFPLNVEKAGIDFLSADSHKWMLGLPGIGFLYVAPTVLRRVRPVLVGWKSSVDAFNFDNPRFVLPDNARKFEEGSPAYLMIAGMGAAVDVLTRAGVDRIADHIRDLLRRLEDRALASGAITAVGPAPHERAGILTLAPVADVNRCQQLCNDHNIKVSIRRGRLRVAPHLFNNASDIDALIDVLANVK